MIPNTVLLLILVVAFALIAYFSSGDKRVKKIIEKRSNFVRSLILMQGEQNVDKTILTLAKDFKYSLEFHDAENKKYVLSDKMTLFSWGFYYLIEFSGGKVDVYLKPRFPFEINKFGMFERRLRRISELIPLIESSLVKG